MHARNHALFVLFYFAKHRSPDARHDTHVHYDVGGIGELNADFCERRTDGTHAEGEHVHGAAEHCGIEETLELAAHVVGIFPIVGGAGGVFGVRADEGAIFDAGDVVGVRAGIEAAGPEFLV